MGKPDKSRAERPADPKLAERVSTWSTRYGLIRVREMGGSLEAVQLARDAKVPASWVPMALFDEAASIIAQLREVAP